MQEQEDLVDYDVDEEEEKGNAAEVSSHIEKDKPMKMRVKGRAHRRQNFDDTYEERGGNYESYEVGNGAGPSKCETVTKSKICT
jgi:hypothetical protein